MSDAQLSQQLRALRQPAPASDFEARLQQALLREAQSMTAERASERSGGLLRLRRWGARMGVGVALSLGATAAAAAAGGVWVLVAERTPESSAIEAAPANEMAIRARQRAAVARGASKAKVAAPLLQAEEARVAASPAVVPVEAPSAAGSSRAAQGLPAADQTVAAQRHAMALPARAVTRAAPARANADSSLRKANLAPPAHSRGNPGAVNAAPGAEAAELLLPFELPERGKAAPSRPLPARERDPAPVRPPRPAVERRPLPHVQMPAEGRRARPERTERGSGAWPPGRATARERSGRDSSERGRERAREARERK